MARKFKDKTFMFLKDSNNFPYGTKSKEELINIGMNCLNQLLQYKPSIICIACNTMCCVLENISLSVPVFKINEQIVVQVKQTFLKKKKILVISTNATKNSKYYQKSLNNYNVIVKATPELVNMVESKKISKKIVAKAIQNESFDYDGIVLGCTHFNYLYDIINELLRNNVYIFDGLKSLEESITYYYNNK